MTRVEWVADRIRRRNAEQNGVPERELLAWPQLKQSEQRQWLGLAEAAVEAMRPC